MKKFDGVHKNMWNTLFGIVILKQQYDFDYYTKTYWEIEFTTRTCIRSKWDTSLRAFPNKTQALQFLCKMEKQAQEDVAELYKLL